MADELKSRFETAEVIALISHPGWHIYRKQFDETVEKIRHKFSPEDQAKVFNFSGQEGHVRRCMIQYNDKHSGSIQQIAEFEYIRRLKELGIPIISTLPTIGANLSEEMSPSYDAFCEDFLQGEVSVCTRENLHGKVSGYIDERLVWYLSELIKGKRVLFSGNNLNECMLGTLRSISSIEAHVEIQLPYSTHWDPDFKKPFELNPKTFEKDCNEWVQRNASLKPKINYVEGELLNDPSVVGKALEISYVERKFK